MTNQSIEVRRLFCRRLSFEGNNNLARLTLTTIIDGFVENDEHLKFKHIGVSFNGATPSRSELDPLPDRLNANSQGERISKGEEHLINVTELGSNVLVTVSFKYQTSSPLTLDEISMIRISLKYPNSNLGAEGTDGVVSINRLEDSRFPVFAAGVPAPSGAGSNEEIDVPRLVCRSLNFGAGDPLRFTATPLVKRFDTSSQLVRFSNIGISFNNGVPDRSELSPLADRLNDMSSCGESYLINVIEHGPRQYLLPVTFAYSRSASASPPTISPDNIDTIRISMRYPDSNEYGGGKDGIIPIFPLERTGLPLAP